MYPFPFFLPHLFFIPRYFSPQSYFLTFPNRVEAVLLALIICFSQCPMTDTLFSGRTAIAIATPYPLGTAAGNRSIAI
jgi:hypothetical protein